MPVSLSALVLPAFDDIDTLPSERAPWERAYSFTNELSLPGLVSPLRYTDAGVGVVPTGIGKVPAATTVTTLLMSDRIDLSETLILTVGVAGGPPRLPIGSVVVADAIVDWDHKCRVDPDDNAVPLAMNPYTQGVAVDLPASHVELAVDAGDDVPLRTGPDGTPTVVRGTNVCGDELWHGSSTAEQVQWLVGEHGQGPYCATEMEDAGTAAALRRFDAVDQYLCLRGIANYDRPVDDRSARDSLFSPRFEAGFDVAVENVTTVARQVIDGQLQR